MSYPLIIIGAGASYDYIKDSDRRKPDDFRPPLTADLFSRRFEAIIKKHGGVKNLAATILPALRYNNDFESVLLSIKEKEGRHSDRASQFMDLQFYLQKLFQEISDHYGDQTGNNYRSLIQEIRDGLRQACIVTFNYDLLLEEALSDQITDNLDSYITGPIKVIKTHGSCDWVYGFDQYAETIEGSIDDPYEYLLKDPGYPQRHGDNFGERRKLYRQREYRIVDNTGKHHNYYPAIAIPLPGKNKFICPPKHINELERALSEIDKILIIGWRANDQQMVDLIKQKVKQPVGLTVISGSKEGIEHVCGKFSDAGNISRAAERVGFSDFMGSAECKTFFGTG